MAQTATRKIILSASRDIPFNKLLLSGCNVRRTKAGVSIGELADDIARRGLLQGLTVRPVLDADGVETGMFEIPAGGRRYRALELLVKQKRLARTAPIPCVIRIDGIAEEDSLAENVQRAPLHPLDQFRAFLTLREKGQSEEEIAATFFVSVAVVRQRLRLAAVSPRLLDAYAEDAMTLDQLMAFTVSGDHERQDQVWDRLQSAYSKDPHVIRRMLTEGAVRASDKRALFIGIDAYEAAGGTVLRDLFQGDNGGWLQDVVLVDRLVAERLEREATVIRAEGWRWIEVAPDFPYGHSFGLRQLRGETLPLTAAEEAELDALRDEYCALEEAHAQDEGVPDAVDRRLTEIEARLTALDERPVRFDSDEVARAGAFITIDGDGTLHVERGYVRPEDELPVVPEPEPDEDTQPSADDGAPTSATPGSGLPRASRTDSRGTSPLRSGHDDADDDARSQAGSSATAEPEEEDGIKPLPDRLMAELTTHRTLALRHVVGGCPDVAFLAALHALCLKLFYPYMQDSCLELDLRQVAFTAQPPGLAESEPAKAIQRRHQSWAGSLPREASDLWNALAVADDNTRQCLFAHCVGASVNAVQEAWNRRPRALAHAGQLAAAVQLDMTAAGWTPTVESYLGRVTKARILQAVREAKGEDAPERIAHLKKGEMAAQAQDLLAGSIWLPEALRTPGQGMSKTSVAVPGADADQPADTIQTEANHRTAESTEDLAGDAVRDPAGEPAGDWRSAAE
jgi:ParB family transcriptional regulator, chromosome partitioning protein